MFFRENSHFVMQHTDKLGNPLFHRRESPSMEAQLCNEYAEMLLQ